MGYGWNRDEAADHGVDFAQRRAVAREKVLCMQALWSEDEAEFHGVHVSLPPSFSWPKPVQQPRVRTLVGGGAGPVLFAAIAEYADGWMPIGGAGVTAALDALRRAFVDAGRDPATLEVVPFGTVPDEGKLAHYASIGCTEVVLRIPSGPGPDMLRVLDDYTRFLVRLIPVPGLSFAASIPPARRTASTPDVGMLKMTVLDAGGGELLDLGQDLVLGPHVEPVGVLAGGAVEQLPRELGLLGRVGDDERAEHG